MEKQVWHTPFGALHGVEAAESDGQGCERIRLGEKNVLKTRAGRLIPLYTGGEGLPSLTICADGSLLSVELESPQEIETPVGPFAADGVAFYPSGALLSVRLSRGEAAAREFRAGFKPFTVPAAELKFYESGALREIIFAQGAHAEVWPEPFWRIRARFGVTLHESGEIQSVEPAHPVKAITPCGTYNAYDPNAHKAAGTHRSLQFDTLARVTAVTTAGDRVYVRPSSGSHYAEFVPDLSEGRQIPLRLTFDYDAENATIIRPDGRAAQYAFEDEFIVYPNAAGGCDASGCEACGMCD
jgi:hypothetical protein